MVSISTFILTAILVASTAISIPLKLPTIRRRHDGEADTLGSHSRSERVHPLRLPQVAIPIALLEAVVLITAAELGPKIGLLEFACLYLAYAIAFSYLIITTGSCGCFSVPAEKLKRGRSRRLAISRGTTIRAMASIFAVWAAFVVPSNVHPTSWKATVAWSAAVGIAIGVWMLTMRQKATRYAAQMGSAEGFGQSVITRRSALKGAGVIAAGLAMTELLSSAMAGPAYADTISCNQCL